VRILLVSQNYFPFVGGVETHVRQIAHEFVRSHHVAIAAVNFAPYQQAFSSSVVARAKLFDRPVIVTDVGGLGAQVGPQDRLLDNLSQLTDAMNSMLVPASAIRPAGEGRAR